MNNNLNTFIKNLFSRNKEYAFYYSRFSKDPRYFFKEIESDKYRDHINTFEYKYMFLNNDFIALLDLLTDDKSFLSKMNNETYSTLMLIIYESVYYHSHITLSDTFTSLYGLNLKNEAKMIPEEQIKEFNVSNAINLYNKIAKLANDYYILHEHEEVREENSEFREILEDVVNFALYIKSIDMSSDVAITLFACDNSFLYISEELINSDLYNNISLKNIIDMLVYSKYIYYKRKHNSLVDEKKISSYNIEKCNDILKRANDLYNKKSKVLVLRNL